MSEIGEGRYIEHNVNIIDYKNVQPKMNTVQIELTLQNKSTCILKANFKISEILLCEKKQ